MYGGLVGRGSTTAEGTTRPADAKQRVRNLIANRLEELKFVKGTTQVQVGGYLVRPATDGAYLVEGGGGTIRCETLPATDLYLRQLLDCE